MALILGISPGTSYIGFALFKDRQLLHWHTQTMGGRWSPKKHRKLLMAIGNEIAHNNPTHIAVKIPDNFAHKKRMTSLISGINILCERNEIHPLYFTLWQIKQHFKEGGKIPKDVIHEFIGEKYPSLQAKYIKSKEVNYNYYTKMFEAVTVAYILQQQL